MKNFAKYICLFLVVVGINVNAWGAGDYSITINNVNLVGCSAAAGNPTSFMTNSNSTIELHYTIPAGKDASRAQISVKNGTTEVYDGNYPFTWWENSATDCILYIYNNNASYWRSNQLNISINVPSNGMYLVTYDAGEGETDCVSAEQAEGEITLCESTPTRTGYTFSGWNDGSSVELWSAGATDFPLIEDVTLTASWTPVTTVITVNHNGGTSNGELWIDYDSDEAEVATAVGTNGRTLTGYYTAAKGGSLIINSDMTLPWYVNGYIRDGVWRYDGDELTLYAQYDDVLYENYMTYCPKEVTFSLNGKSGEAPANQSVKRGSLLTEPATPVVGGYTFLGWFEEEAGENEWVFASSTVQTAMTLYAKWSDLAQTEITLNANGGVADGYCIATYGDSHPVCASTTRTGYEYNGYWTAAEDGEQVFAADGTLQGGVSGITDETGHWISMATEKTLYAHWTPIEYTITYVNAVNGVNDVANSNPATYTIETATFSLEYPTRTGYAFAGWYSDEELSTPASTTIELGSTGNKTFYAKWDLAVTSITITSTPVEGVSEIPVGATLQLAVTYSPAEATAGNAIASWTVDNETFLGVSASGLVTGKVAGNGHYVTATTTNGVQNTYYINVIDAACENKWQVHMWNTEQSTNTRVCLSQVGDTHEWRSEQVTLPSNSDAEKLKVLYNGMPQTHSREWITRWVTMVSRHNDAQYYAGQDAVGYFRIYDDSSNDNYYLQFEPIYRLTYGHEGQSDWVAHDFAATSTANKYETEVVKVPAGYFSDAAHKFYVGTKNSSDGTNFVMSDDSHKMSNTVSLNTMGGLTSDQGGKYGYYYIYNNSNSQNWFCHFVAGYAYELRNDDETLIYAGTSKTEEATTLYNEGLPTKTGYTLIGWSRAKNATEATLALGADYGFRSSLDVFYPVWQANEYTFTLDKNTGDADGSVTINYDATAATSITNATKMGYTLQGYNSTAGTDGKGGGTKVLNTDGTIANNLSKWVVDGKWIQTDEEAVLYAAWKANTYTVAYNGNGNTSGSMSTSSHTYDAAKALTANKYAKTGYDFAGWSTTAEGAVEYSDGESVSNLTTTNDATVTLYAQWTRHNYTVTYHDAEGTQTEDVAYESTPAGLTARACAEGRVFVGWSTREITSAVQAEPELVNPTMIPVGAANVDYYAVYASQNGGKVETLIANESFSAAPADWQFSDPSHAAVVNGAAELDYLSRDASTVEYVQSKVKFSDLNKIVLDAYITGSYTEHRYAVQYSTDGESWTTIGENKKLSANTAWDVNQEFVMPSIHDAYVRIVTVPYGYATAYSLRIDNIRTYAKHRVFLTDYATSCDFATPSITWEDNDGALADGQSKPEAAQNTLITLPAMERGCYNFNGWQATIGSENLGIYRAGEQYLLNHDVTFTAQWTVNSSAEVTVTYHTGLEGAETQTVSGVHCGDILTDVQVPTPAACGQNEFAGWAIGEFENAASKDGIAQYTVGTDVVMGDMELHAIWKQGKSVFTKYTETDVEEGTYILVDPTSSKALSATLVPTPVTIDGATITTDENFIQWTVSKVGEKFSIHGLDGYLTITADKTNALGISNTAVETWNMKESSTNGVYNIGITFDASDRRVCYNSTKDKWLSYKNRTSGNLYKLSGDGPATFTMDGVCPHIYHATGVSEMTSGTGVSVLAKDSGLIIVENTSVVPVAQKVSGDDVFEVTINPTSTGVNGDGSLNYEYSVKFTPTAGNQTYTATYKFIGNGETEDEKHIASETITVTGYSLPDEFAIVAVKNGQYFAMPGDVPNAEASANAIPVTVFGGEIIDLDMAHAYSVYTGSRTTEDRTTVRMKSTTGALWASNSSTNIYNFAGDLTANTAAATTNTQWTLERAYDDDDNFLGYHLISDADSEKGLFYNSGHWGYYSNSRYGGEYAGEIFFLPIAAQFGDMMDIVEWNSSSVVLNMNGYGATAGKWGVKNASDEMLLAANRATDRTLVVSTAALVADQYLNIKVYGNANNAPAVPVVESNRNYKIPHIMEGTQSISSAASFSATSILYVKSGTTTVNVSLTVAKVVVCPGAELVVASGKTLTTTDLVLRGKIWSYEQPKLTNNGTLNATNTYYTRIVANKTEYYPFALPKSSSVEAVRLSNGQPVTYGETSNWNLKSYNASAQLNNQDKAWDNVPAGTINAKTYYLMGSGSAYYREYYFPISLSESVDNTVAIAANQGTAETLDKNKGWNGFATPFTDVYTNAPTGGDPSDFVKVTEKVENNTQWWQHVPSQLYPFFPYFYQTEAAGTLSFGSGLTFEASAPASVAARTQAEETAPQATTQWIQLTLTNERGEQDETNLYVHPSKFTSGYDRRYDLQKMLGDGERPQMYTEMACGKLAFNALPDSVAATRIPVGVVPGTATELTFSLGREDYLDRVEAINFVDTELGTTTNLLLSDYTCSTEDGTNGRFYLNVELHRVQQTPTSLDDLDSVEALQPQKVIINDMLYILVGERVYDAAGKVVK